MTGDRSKFVNIIPKQERHVTYEGNNKGRILGRGSIRDKSILLIYDVLYVEELKHNYVTKAIKSSLSQTLVKSTFPTQRR